MNNVCEKAEPRGFAPEIPARLSEAGLSDSIVEQLIFKHLYFRDELVGRDLANGLGLKFSLIDGIMENLKRHHFVQVKGALGFGAVSSVFSLSELGRARAREALERNQYCGPAPVPVAQYVEAVRSQRLKNG